MNGAMISASSAGGLPGWLPDGATRARPIVCRWGLTFRPLASTFPSPVDGKPPAVKNPPPPLLPGTLDLLVLRTLVRGPLHGYGIALRVKELSQEVLQV